MSVPVPGLPLSATEVAQEATEERMEAEAMEAENSNNMVVDLGGGVTASIPPPQTALSSTGASAGGGANVARLEEVDNEIEAR